MGYKQWTQHSPGRRWVRTLMRNPDPSDRDPREWIPARRWNRKKGEFEPYNGFYYEWDSDAQQWRKPSGLKFESGPDTEADIDIFSVYVANVYGEVHKHHRAQHWTALVTFRETPWGYGAAHSEVGFTSRRAAMEWVITEMNACLAIEKERSKPYVPVIDTRCVRDEDLEKYSDDCCPYPVVGGMIP